MMWFPLAFTSALLTGTSDALSKRLLSHTDDRIVAWARILFALPWLSAGLLMGGWPELGRSFWILILVMTPVELVAYLLYLRSIRISPLSLCIPFLAFTPILTVATGWLLLGEKVTWPGLLGVASVTLGAYVLQIEHAARGILEPFRAMMRVPGIRLMLVTSALFSVPATLGKRAIALSSPTAFPLIYYLVDSLILTGLAGSVAGSPAQLVKSLRPGLWGFFLLGALTAGSIFAYTFGIRLVPVAYFISVKRLSLLVSVLYGGLLFRETAFRQRLAGTALMLAGTALISLLG